MYNCVIFYAIHGNIFPIIDYILNTIKCFTPAKTWRAIIYYIIISV